MKLFLLLLTLFLCAKGQLDDPEGMPADLSICPSSVTNHFCFGICETTAIQMGVDSLGNLCRKSLRGMVCEGETKANWNCDCVAKTECNRSRLALKCQEHPLLTESQTHFASDIPSEICSAGDVTYRQCSSTIPETRNLFAVVTKNNKVIPLASAQGRMVTDYTSPTSYNCSGCGTDEQCHEKVTQGECTGDTTFSSFFRSGSGNCFCSARSDRAAQAWRVADSLRLYKCWGTVIMQLGIRTREPERSPDEHHLEITCNDRGLKVDSPGEKVIKYKSCVNPTCVSGRAESDEFEIEWTTNMLYSGGLSTTSLWIEGFSQPVTRNKVCPPVHLCEVLECWLCTDRLVNYHCFTWWQWIILASFAVLVLNSLGYVWKALLILIRVIWFVVYPLLIISRILVRKTRKGVKARYDRLTLEDEESVYRSTVTTEVPVIYSDYRPTSRVQALKKQALAGIVLLSLTNVSSGCSYGTWMTAQARECSVGTAGSVCTMSEVARLSVSPYGQESCLGFKSSTGEAIASLHLKTKDITVRCTKQSMYWVPEPEKYCYSMKHCWSVGWCSGGGCNNINTSFQEPSWPIHNNGETRCQNSCGCAGCGCGLCSDGCLLYRSGFLNPSRESWEVFRCPAWEFEVKVEADYITSSSKKKTLILKPGKLADISGISLSLVSATTPLLPVLDECFAQNGAEVLMMKCADRGAAVKGLLGEIQCPTSHAAEELDESCLYSKDLISITTLEDGITCAQETISPKLTPKEMKLPYQTESLLITDDENGLRAEISQSPLLEIQVNARDLLISFSQSEGLCSARFLNMSGCYSCASGAEVHFSYYSKITSDFVLDCPSFFLRHVVGVGRTKKSFTVNVDRSKFEELCSLKCGKHSETIQITGNLQYSKFTKRVTRGFTHITPGGNLTAPSLPLPSLTFGLGLPTVVGIGAVIYLVVRRRRTVSSGKTT